MQRLLDLDAIEIAHEALRGESREAHDVLRGAAIALQQAGGDRDLDTELSEASAKAAFARAALAELDTALVTCNAQHAEAHAAQVALLDLKRRHDAFDAERGRIAVVLAREEANAAAAQRTLDALTEREVRATTIAPDVARLPGVVAALHDAEAAAAHAQKIQRAAAAVRGAEETVAALSKQVDALVAELDPLRDLLFAWEDVAEAAPGLARAHTLAQTLAGTGPRLVESTAQQKAWDALTRLAEERDRAATRAKEATNAIAQIEARLHATRAGGDPVASVEALTRRDLELREQAATQQGEYNALRADHKRFSDLLKRWKAADADEPCPTCGRPFDEDAAAIMRESLQRNIAQCTEQGQAIKTAIDATQREGRDVNATRQIEEARLKDVHALDAQRAQAVRQEADARERANAAQTTLARAVKEAGRRALPGDSEMRDLADEIHLLTRGANAAGQAMQLARQITAAEAETTARRDALLALGPDMYNAALHAGLRAEHEWLIALHAEAQGITGQLAVRPETEARLAAARRALTDGETETVRLMAEQEALGFDPDALLDAATRVAALAAQRDEATAARNDERLALHDAENAVAEIERERGAHRHLASERGGA